MPRWRVLTRTKQVSMATIARVIWLNLITIFLTVNIHEMKKDTGYKRVVFFNLVPIFISAQSWIREKRENCWQKFILRNYSRWRCTMHAIFQDWLDYRWYVNTNIALLLEFCEVWFSTFILTRKSSFVLSYVVISSMGTCASAWACAIKLISKLISTR